MATRSVILELPATPPQADGGGTPTIDAVRALGLGIVLDASFPPTSVPPVAPAQSTYMVRGRIKDDAIAAVAAHPDVVGVFADVAHQPLPGGCGAAPRAAIDVCRLHPAICRVRPVPAELCRRYPWLCQGPLPQPPQPIGGKGAPARGLFGASGGTVMADLSVANLFATLTPEELADVFYTLGLADGAAGEGRQDGARSAGATTQQPACGCGGHAA